MAGYLSSVLTVLVSANYTTTYNVSRKLTLQKIQSSLLICRYLQYFVHHFSAKKSI